MQPVAPRARGAGGTRVETSSRVFSTVAVVVATGAVVTGLLGCGRTGGPDVAPPAPRVAGIADLDRRVESPRPIECGVGRHWSVDEGAWTFRVEATLHCRVATDGPTSAVVELEPTGDTARFAFGARLDGEPLRGDAVATRAEGVLEIRVPQVGPGWFAITVVRDLYGGRPEDRNLHDNTFRRIRVRAGDVGDLELATERVDELRYVGTLVERGVTGLGSEKRSGMLVRGPMDGTLELESAVPATLRLHTENASSRLAAFRLVGPDGTQAVSEVQPRSSGALDLAVPAGTSSVRMVLEGDPDGLFLWGAPQLARAGDDRPSVILVTLDTTRRDALSPWGGRPDVSPRLEQFARSATVYDHAWATSPWTLPSHASMLTGMYPTRHGAGVSEDWMVPSLESLAELLAGEGWFTAGFAGGEMCASRWGVAQGFDVYHDPDGFETRGDALTDAALEIVARHGDAPLFLFVNYFDPHALYRAPEPFASRFGVPELAQAIADTPVWGDFARGSGKAWGSIIEGEAPAGAAELEWLEAAYLAEVAFMDHQLGRLFDGLDARGVLDDALVVVVADHGEFLGENGFFSHACRLEPELTWVPMLVRWPGQTRADRSAQLVSHVDVFGTALQAAGLPVRSHDGLPLGAEGQDALTARSRVFMEEHESRIHPLFAHMKIAPSVYGIQELAHREVIWQGGMDCGRLSGDRWTTDRCGATWQDRLTELADVARALERRDEAEVGVLSEAEREALEALGYVR